MILDKSNFNFLNIKNMRLRNSTIYGIGASLFITILLMCISVDLIAQVDTSATGGADFSEIINDLVGKYFATTAAFTALVMGASKGIVFLIEK